MKGKPHKTRNPHASHPIMRKGGYHQKSKGALRAEAKRNWKNERHKLPSFSLARLPHLPSLNFISFHFPAFL